MTDVQTDVSDHVPTNALGDGRSRCEACGYLWPCPDVRMQPRTLEEGERLLLELAIASIDIGYSVRKLAPAGADYDPLGGLVVAVFDDDDGRRCYRTTKFIGRYPRTTVLGADEIDPATVAGPRSDIVRGHARRLAEIVGRNTGAASSDEVEMLSDALRLMAAIA